MTDNEAVYSPGELAAIKELAEDGVFDHVDGVCEVRLDGIRLYNPFRSNSEFLGFLTDQAAKLPRWIKECESLDEFLSVLLLEVAPYANHLAESGGTHQFLAAYQRARKTVSRAVQL